MSGELDDCSGGPVSDRILGYREGYRAALAEIAPSASGNSDYAAALRLYEAYSQDVALAEMTFGFADWCKQRLNARPGHSA